MKIRDVQFYSATFGPAVAELIDLARNAADRRRSGGEGVVRAEVVQRRDRVVAGPHSNGTGDLSSAEGAAIATALLGVGVRHWLDRHSGPRPYYVVPKGRGRRSGVLMPVAAAPAADRPGKRRWFRRTVATVVVARAAIKVREILDENDRDMRAREPRVGASR